MKKIREPSALFRSEKRMKNNFGARGDNSSRIEDPQCVLNKRTNETNSSSDENALRRDAGKAKTRCGAGERGESLY